jgi:hypothetical protein
MARVIGRLTPATVKSATKIGLHCDGGGLYIRVGKAGNRSQLSIVHKDRSPRPSEFVSQFMP